MTGRSRFVADEQNSDALEIARQSLDESIADHLRDLIVRGEMAPGARLNLPELASGLGVSTTPLREALKILADEQIVEWQPGRGARVAPIRADETVALFEVIASLEALAAEQACARMSAAQLAEMESMHARMRVHFERKERDPYFEINSRIHSQILTLAENEILQATHARLHGRASRGRYAAIVDEARWHEAMQEHEDLMKTLRDRQPDRSSGIWRQHLINTGAAVKRAQLADFERRSSKGSK